MLKQTFKFKSVPTDIYFNQSFSQLKKIIDIKQTVVITDENVFASHQQKFKHYNTIVLKAGEAYKTQATIDSVIEQLINFNADRKTFLLGVGGGVVLDITGFVASIYMRGIAVGFVPTTLLSLVDASIGGKNGINFGHAKNMVGSFKQPQFIFHDISFLTSLHRTEWQQGFAEIIKHACIADEKLFNQLQQHNIDYYKKNKKELLQLIQQNVTIKANIVLKDEHEKSVRKKLNFGHTIGHAIEMQYEVTHGHAVAIGITYANEIAEKLLEFKQKEIVTKLLEQYELPTYSSFNKNKIISLIKMDKKKEQQIIHFILLQKIGKAIIQPISFPTLEQYLKTL